MRQHPVCLFAAVAFCAVGAARAAEVPVAAAGQARLPIVLVDPTGKLSEDKLVGPSLADLRATLKKMTGAEFELETVQALPQEPCICVGLADVVRAAAVPEKLEDQEYVLRTTAEGQVLLVGAGPRGVSHAIYGFLHALGCRWYYPGEDWAVTPRRETLKVELNEHDGPDFPVQRRIWIGHGIHSPRIQEDFTNWRRRNCMAEPFGVWISHNWVGLNPEKDLADHPQWFGEVSGERKAKKPCYSNPEVIEKGIASALQHFEKNPDAEMYSSSAPDGLGFCTCELCRKQSRVVETFEAHGTTFGRQADGTVVSLASETIFNFANKLAEATEKRFPGKKVGILAYSAYAHPPTFKLHPSIYVELTRGYRRTPLTQTQQIIAFADKASCLGIYEYYDVEQWSWEHPGKARASKLDYLQSSIRFYHKYKMRALSGEMSNNFGPNGVGYYVIARLLWDAQADARAIEEEFYQRAFGPAAAPVKRLYRRWEAGQGFDHRALGLAFRDLDEAVRLTEKDPECRRRVDCLRMYAHFLARYVPPQGGKQEQDAASVSYLAQWASRLMDTHMVHSWAFNRYLTERGKALGCDTSSWMKPGAVPTAEETDALFKKDMEQWAGETLSDVPATLFGQKLVPVTSAEKPVPMPPQHPIETQSFRAGQMHVRLQAGETLTVAFDREGVEYSLDFTPAEEFESGAAEFAALPAVSGKAAGKELQLKAEAPGYYTLHWSEAAVTAVSHPHAIDGDAVKFQGGRLHFFVPRGTRHFLLHAGAHGGPTVKVETADGKVVLEQAGFAATKKAEPKSAAEFLITVPDGADGAVWTVIGPGDVNSVASIKLMGIPPYLSLSPQQLLVPGELIK